MLFVLLISIMRKSVIIQQFEKYVNPQTITKQKQRVFLMIDKTNRFNIYLAFRMQNRNYQGKLLWSDYH